MARRLAVVLAGALAIVLAGVLVGTALAACGRSEPAAVLATSGTSGSARQPTAVVSVIPPATRELVTAIVDDWSSTKALLQRWKRDASSAAAALEA